MSKLYGTLAELARMRSGDEPIVSLYLGVRVLEEKRRDEVRLFVHDRVRRVASQDVCDPVVGRAKRARWRRSQIRPCEGGRG